MFRVQTDRIDTSASPGDKKVCLHGGRGFERTGEDFKQMQALGSFVPADVLDSWYLPSPKVLKLLREHSEWASHTSPPVHGNGLKQAIAQARGIELRQIVLGQGSSDLIFRVLPKIVLGDGPVLLPSPVYGEYFHVLANLYGKSVVRFSTEMDSFELNVDRLIQTASELLPSAIILVNPCNPTGKFVSRKNLLRILNEMPASTKLIIDETYIDYVPAECMEQEVANFPQLVILKSMSKVYGLSGLRVGYGVFSPALAEELNPFTPPYVVSTLGQMAAIAALEDKEYMEERLAETREARDSLAKKLSALPGLKVVRGAINSLLIDCQDTLWTASELVQHLAKRGIFIRMIDDQGMLAKSRFIRISIMGASENERVVAAFTDRLSENK